MVGFETIEKIEVGKRKSRCRWCYKIILKDEPRGMKTGVFKEHYYKSFYCNKCGQKDLSLSIKRLNKTIKEMKKFKVDLRKLTTKSKAVLIMSVLENEKEKDY